LPPPIQKRGQATLPDLFFFAVHNFSWRDDC
jgi:hypothetical protein